MTIDKSKPLVSICIPVFNGENYLLECVNSALQQDYSNLEILIMDNFSTDSTQLIVSKIDDNRMRYVRNNKNIGALNNFSKCVDECLGEYFVLLPHDDLLLPGFVSEYVKRLQDKAVGLVYSSVNVINAKGISQYTRTIHNTNQKFTSEQVIQDLFVNFMPIQMAMVRTAILKKVGAFDSEYGLFVDIQLWLKVFFDDWECFFLTKPYSAHRSHAEQGQAAFLQLKLDILGDHWGKKLDKEFWKENSYNIFFLRIMKFVDNELKRKNYNSEIINLLMLKIFIRSHIRFIALSIIRFNRVVLWQELSLFSAIIKFYGFIKVIYYYPLVFINEVKKMLIK
ncbi:glycosyltransferase family 2 protein [Candidatus Pseudothioglobus singularis]|nr:glycosyltransferase family 2 protein [Candidatus Pseudothioglobus singularis]